MTSNNPQLLKGLLREIYLLLLALLAFINFFIPAMIHTVYAPDTMMVQDRLWAVIDDGNSFHRSLRVGSEIGLAIGDGTEWCDCYQRAGSKDLSIAWGPSGKSMPFQIRHKTRGLKILAWLAHFPPTSGTRPETPDDIRAPVRVVIFHDRDWRDIHDELREKRIAKHRLVLELTPQNHFETDTELPEEWVKGV